MHAVQSGAQDYLVKGRVDGAALGRSLSYAIERARLAREREEALRREAWQESLRRDDGRG